MFPSSGDRLPARTEARRIDRPIPGGAASPPRYPRSVTITTRESTGIRIPGLDRLLQTDRAYNYFIRLGIESRKSVFSRVFTEEDDDGAVVGALFLRSSGTVQFHALDAADFAAFGRIATEVNPVRIQGRPDVLRRLAPHCPPAKTVLAAHIHRKRLAGADHGDAGGVRELRVSDLPRVVELYERVFRGFSSLHHMQRKLETGRGRGYYTEDSSGGILSIVQTEFEEDGECAIVGVATHPDRQRRGLAGALMRYTEARLSSDGIREVYLQFDSEAAKKLYEKLGYLLIGRVAYLTPQSSPSAGGGVK